MAQMTDAIDLQRRLWRGELIMGHDGPAGSYPMLCLDPSFDADIPVTVTAIGERTLEWAGGVADAVVLHTFFTDDDAGPQRRRGAPRRRAGRAATPQSVRIWSVLATVGDHLDEELRLKKLVGRLATYLQGYGDLMVRVNDWDPEVLARFRADEFVRRLRRGVRRQGHDRGPADASPSCCPTSGSTPPPPAPPTQCAAAGARPVRPGRRRRHPARRDTGRAGAGRRGLP